MENKIPEIFEHMNIRITITTNQRVHEHDSVCMKEAVKWWNQELDNIDFNHSDYIRWLEHNGISDI
jgi:uncharacterized protein (DUF342 family)